MKTDDTHIRDDQFEGFSDEEVWTLFKQGDKQAFEFIFKKYNPVLYHIGIKFFYDPELVEDGIQELFLKLWENKENIAEVSTVKYYLIVSLRRSLVRKLKGSRKQSDQDNLMNATCHPLHVASHENQLIVAQLIKEKADQLTLAIEQLPPRQKEAVYLKFYEEKTYEEITAIMSINYQTARKFIYKAIIALRKSLHARTSTE